MRKCNITLYNTLDKIYREGYCIEKNTYKNIKITSVYDVEGVCHVFGVVYKGRIEGELLKDGLMWGRKI